MSSVSSDDDISDFCFLIMPLQGHNNAYDLLWSHVIFENTAR